MRFKELTKADIDYITTVYLDKNRSWIDRMVELSEYTGNSERAVQYWVKQLGLVEKGEVNSPEFEDAKSKKLNKKKKRFLVTWAQNNTPVHKNFFNNMKAYAKKIDADIHVIAGRYKNPTSMFDSEEEVWDSAVSKYLDANRHKIHKYMTIMSDVKIQPTAVNPLTGLRGMSKENSSIFGSPKVQMEAVSVLDPNKPKLMLTTGACTVKNYTDSKAGKKGEFHHQLGFVIVEIKNKDTFFVRQVTADDNGDFMDLVFEVTEGKIKKVKSIKGCALGDLHAGQHDEEVLKATHKMMSVLKPDNVILHDVFDGYSISHHDLKDPILQYQKELTNENDLELELANMMELLGEFRSYKNVIIARANHDDFLDRWIKFQDWKKQPTPKNYLMYAKLLALLLSETEESDNPRELIPILINDNIPEFRTLQRDESCKIGNWEVSMHGDVGCNGSRGSIEQFRKLNVKLIVGHTHTAGRKDGVLYVGTTTKLRLGYTKGPSSWIHAHVIIHNNDKAQHIIFRKDKNGVAEYTTLI